MPSVSDKQQRYMGMELAKERETGSNDTGMNESQLADFARKGNMRPTRKLNRRGARKLSR